MPSVIDTEETQLATQEEKSIQEASVTQLMQAPTREGKQAEMLQHFVEGGFGKKEMALEIIRGIREAIYQGPKGDIMEDWKTKTKLMELMAKLTGMTDNQTIINVMTAFGGGKAMY